MIPTHAFNQLFDITSKGLFILHTATKLGQNYALCCIRKENSCFRYPFLMTWPISSLPAKNNFFIELKSQNSKVHDKFASLPPLFKNFFQRHSFIFPFLMSNLKKIISMVLCITQFFLSGSIWSLHHTLSRPCLFIKNLFSDRNTYLC